jgi:protein-tyrosine phosphatase
VNAAIWTRKLPPFVAVSDGVFLGRFPTASEASGFGTVIDLAAELEKPAPADCRWISFPMIDLLPPPVTMLEQAASALESARRGGTVLVCCALGFQRSAGVLAEWLVATGRARTPKLAREMLMATGRPVHLAEAEERAA